MKNKSRQVKKIEKIKKEKEEQHLKNIREAIKSLKGSLKLLEGSSMGLDKNELRKELEALEERERLMVLRLRKSKS